jgi:hypothetical protein
MSGWELSEKRAPSSAGGIASNQVYADGKHLGDWLDADPIRFKLLTGIN